MNKTVSFFFLSKLLSTWVHIFMLFLFLSLRWVINPNNFDKKLKKVHWTPIIPVFKEEIFPWISSFRLKSLRTVNIVQTHPSINYWVGATRWYNNRESGTELTEVLGCKIVTGLILCRTKVCDSCCLCGFCWQIIILLQHILNFKSIFIGNCCRWSWIKGLLICNINLLRSRLIQPLPFWE